MEFDLADLGRGSESTEIKDYTIVLYEDMVPDLTGCLIKEILIEFISGQIISVDGSFLEDVKEAKARRLVVHIETGILVSNVSWNDKEIHEDEEEEEEEENKEEQL